MLPDSIQTGARSIKCLVLVLATLLAATGVQAEYETEGPVDFTLERLDEGSSSLSDFRGQWLVLNYWATWCAPCRNEIPELSALHAERDDLTVLGLAFEDTEESEFEAFLSELKPLYPILLVDVYAPPEPFGAPMILPTTILLDPTGRSVKAFAGQVTREQIEQFIESFNGHD